MRARVAAAAAKLRGGRAGKIALYGASRSITDGLLGGRGLVLAALLGPDGFGIWALFRLAMRYASSAGLGVNRGLEREVAEGRTVARGGLHGEAELSARTAVGFKLAVFVVLSVSALAVSFLISDPEWRLGLRGFAAATVASQLVTYGLIYTRATGALRRFAWIEIANAAMHFAFASAGALWGGLPGAFAGFVVASLCSVALLAGHVPLRPAFSWPRLRRLLDIGLPVSLALFTSGLLQTVDRLVVAAFGGTTMLGYYAFAAAVAGLATSFAWVIRTVVFPDVYGEVRSAGKRRAVHGHLHDTILPFARYYPPLLGALALAIAPAVAIATPQYALAVDPARIFIFAGATLGFVSLGSVGVVAADRQRMLPLFSAVGLVLNVSLATLALRSGLGLTAVAAGSLLSQAVYGAAILTLASRAAGIHRPLRLLLRCYLPILWCVAAVQAVTWWISDDGVAGFLSSVAVYALLVLPLLLRGDAGERERAGNTGGRTPRPAERADAAAV